VKNMGLVILSALTTWERRQADEVYAVILVTAYSCSDGEWDFNSVAVISLCGVEFWVMGSLMMHICACSLKRLPK
jgi:hypothetical protein